MILQSPGFVQSRDKLNAIYLHLKKIHEHQTRQGFELPSDALTLKAIWHFDKTKIKKTKAKTNNAKAKTGTI